MKIIDSVRDAVKKAAHFIESIAYLGSEARTAHKLLDTVGIPREYEDDDDPYILALSERINIYAQRRDGEARTARKLLDSVGTPREDKDGEPLCLSDRIKIYAQHRADRPINGLTEDTICIPVSDYDQLCQAAEKYHAKN